MGSSGINAGSWSQKEESSDVRRNLMGREMMRRRDRRWMLVRRRRVREMWVMITTKLRAEIQRKQLMKGVKTMRRARIRRISRKAMKKRSKKRGKVGMKKRQELKKRGREKVERKGWCVPSSS